MSHPQLASLPILYRSNIQDGGIENPIYYHAFRSNITPALQASEKSATLLPSGSVIAIKDIPVSLMLFLLSATAAATEAPPVPPPIDDNFDDEDLPEVPGDDDEEEEDEDEGDEPSDEFKEEAENRADETSEDQSG